MAASCYVCNVFVCEYLEKKMVVCMGLVELPKTYLISFY